MLGLKHRRNSRLITSSEGLWFNRPEQKWKKIFFISSFNKTLLTLSSSWGQEIVIKDTLFLPEVLTFGTGLQTPTIQVILPPSHRRRHKLLQKCREPGTSWSSWKSTGSWVPAQVYSDLTGWPWPNLPPTFGYHSANCQMETNNLWHAHCKQPLS